MTADQCKTCGQSSDHGMAQKHNMKKSIGARCPDIIERAVVSIPPNAMLRNHANDHHTEAIECYKCPFLDNKDIKSNIVCSVCIYLEKGL